MRSIIGFIMLFILHGTFATSLLEAADQIYSALTAHEQNHSVPVQLVNSAGNFFSIGAKRFIDNLNNRRQMNSDLLRVNADAIVEATTTLKDTLGKTYLGAGVFGAADAFRSLITQVN